MNVVSKSLSRMSLGTIRLYQAVTANRHRVCRFEPTCSAYAAEALEVHGFWRGWGYALRRLASCRPGGRHGWDPVPELAVAKQVREVKSDA